MERIAQAIKPDTNFAADIASGQLNWTNQKIPKNCTARNPIFQRHLLRRKIPPEDTKIIISANQSSANITVSQYIEVKGSKQGAETTKKVPLRLQEWL